MQYVLYLIRGLSLGAVKVHTLEFRHEQLFHAAFFKRHGASGGYQLIVFYKFPNQVVELLARFHVVGLDFVALQRFHRALYSFFHAVPPVIPRSDRTSAELS